jgi:hypothetical protein
VDKPDDRLEVYIEVDSMKCREGAMDDGPEVKT